MKGKKKRHPSAFLPSRNRTLAIVKKKIIHPCKWFSKMLPQILCYTKSWCARGRNFLSVIYGKLIRKKNPWLNKLGNCCILHHPLGNSKCTLAYLKVLRSAAVKNLVSLPLTPCFPHIFEHMTYFQVTLTNMSQDTDLPENTLSVLEYTLY